MKNVLLLLANGFETYEASVFIDVLGWNLTDGDKNTQLFTCGMTCEIKSSFNIIVKPDYLIDNIDVINFDALAIPGGFEEYSFYDDAYSEPFLDLIRKFHTSRKTIASICVAALPLGKSGILNGKKATTYRGKRQAQLKEFGATVIDEPIVIDENIITSWNPSTAIPVALLLLESLTTKTNSEKIKKLMGF
ncbi:MAG: DJ-1/PfpI family protein [Fibrobacter sp.]|nr:DJ-1/PfpI family protein [Fibrobacter sp.]